MISHQDRLPCEQSQRWLQTIRRVRGDVPIVIVGLKCDVPNYNLKLNIQGLCTRYGIPYVELCSSDGTNIHVPFLVLQDILRTSDRNIFVDDPNIKTTPLILPPPPPDQE